MNKKAENYTGRKYGKLTVASLHHIDNGGRRYWLCWCECGNMHIAQGTDLKLGKTTSCGCARKTQRIGDDLSDKKLADVHSGMMRRCYNAEDEKHYKNYGARGVSVCEEWHSLKNFRIWAYNNGYATGLTLDRINVNGNYEPGNCRWVNQWVQANNKRNNRLIEYKREVHTLAEWARIIGISPKTLRYRICKWNIDKALSTPLQKNKSHKRT